VATTCLLLRHAETAISERREWHGRADPPLSARGRAHALQAATLLSTRGLEVASIVSSDQRRTRETAAAFGEVLRRPVLADANLRERDLGEWTGRGREEIEARWPGQLLDWTQGGLAGPPGGETDEEVVARVTGTLLRHAADGAAGLRLVVAHAGLLRALLAANGMPHTEIPPLAGRWLTLSTGRGIVIGAEAAL
jgi:broad specificity phosphatase PhoE